MNEINRNDLFFGYGQLFGEYKKVEPVWNTDVDIGKILYTSQTTEILFDPLYDAFVDKKFYISNVQSFTF